jgi:putative transposase
MDFVSDQLANGRRIRVLNVVDDYSREAILQLPEFSISGLRVTRELDRLLDERDAPRTLVCENGPEFTSKAMFFWASKRRIRIHFIQPGKPTQNAFVESFNGKFRDFCLNLHWFASLQDACEIIEAWRKHYNDVRPHRSLNGMLPSQYARQAA